MQTTPGAGAIRSPARSADRPPAPTAPGPSAYPCGSPAAACARTHPAPAHATASAPTSRHPTAVGAEGAAAAASRARSRRPPQAPRNDLPQNSASVRGWAVLPSTTSIDLRHASSWVSLISPRYSNMALHHTAASNALVLNDTPIAMVLAVRPAYLGAQKHDADHYPQIRPAENRVGRHYSRFPPVAQRQPLKFQSLAFHKF